MKEKIKKLLEDYQEQNEIMSLHIEDDMSGFKFQIFGTFSKYETKLIENVTCEDCKLVSSTQTYLLSENDCIDESATKICIDCLYKLLTKEWYIFI